MTILHMLGTQCNVYSRAETRIHKAVTECVTNDKIDTTGDGKPDDVYVRTVIVTDRRGRYICSFWQASGYNVDLHGGDCGYDPVAP